MYHSIYIRNNPKNKWLLYSVNASAEAASISMEKAIQKAKNEGNDKFEIAVQLHDYYDYIPEMIDEINKKEKLMYN